MLLSVAVTNMYWLLRDQVQEKQNCWHKKRRSCFKQINVGSRKKYWPSALRRILRRI